MNEPIIILNVGLNRHRLFNSVTTDKKSFPTSSRLTTKTCTCVRPIHKLSLPSSPSRLLWLRLLRLSFPVSWRQSKLRPASWRLTPPRPTPPSSRPAGVTPSWPVSRLVSTLTFVRIKNQRAMRDSTVLRIVGRWLNHDSITYIITEICKLLTGNVRDVHKSRNKKEDFQKPVFCKVKYKL